MSSENEDKAITKIEYETRIYQVQQWILDEYSVPEIVMQIKDKWGVEWRQAYRYVSEGRKRWAKRKEEVIDFKRRLAVERLKKMKRSLKEPYKGTPDGIKVLLALEKQIDMLEGLETAQKVEVTGKGGNPIAIEKQVIIVNGMQISF